MNLLIDMLKILIIEDSVEIVDYYKLIIGRIPETTIAGICYDGEEGIRIFDTLKPDIVILDINLPLVNGIKVLKHIKQTTRETITIVVTNHSNAAYLKASKKIGGDYFLDKSKDFEKLAHIIENLSS